MSHFTKKVTTEISLLKCDWCGKEQDRDRYPPMESLKYTYFVESDHGRGGRSSDSELNFCKDPCSLELVIFIRNKRGY